MRLITSTWGNSKTFKLIPASPECVYNEGIYDADSKVLALIGKEKKETLQMLPKLNEFGDLEALKIGKRPNGKDYKEERKTLETFYEYYVEEQSEIIDFVTTVAENSDSFDFKKYFKKEEAPASKIQTV
jgi:hypothetical protein